MANPEHLKILREGVSVWNQWTAYSDISYDLSGADLRKANLSGAILKGVNLRGAFLTEANLQKADLGDAILTEASLAQATLSEAELYRTDLSRSDLYMANLTYARLARANLDEARVVDADFSLAVLREISLVRTDFAGAEFCYTVLMDTDLSKAKGLDSVNHMGPTTIGLDTFFRSGGKIPEVFLRGAGVPDIFIQYAASLAGKPIEFYSAFISYSSKDDDFAKRLHADLQAKGVRCWFDREDLKIGEKFRPKIDEAIRFHDKLLLILSENSVRSDWVEAEVEAAFERERKENKTVLFPIRLDSAVMDIPNGWPATIRRTRNVGDFSNWKDHDSYRKSFDRLIRDLKSKA